MNRSGALAIDRDYARPTRIEGRRNGTDNDNIAAVHEACLLILDARTLEGECLAKSLVARGLAMDVCLASSAEDYRRRRHSLPPLRAILLNIGSRTTADPALGNDISRLAAEFKGVPVVILADTDDLAQILKMLEHGARGFIPSSVGTAICAEAIGLAVAGGIFIPASSVLAKRYLISTDGMVENSSLSDMFTLRQGEVVQALRMGKANKIIAYELNLRESTVKVHVRNIMRKMKATNRTEVAYKLNSLFSDSAP
jgi:DNA-binding NarL/FixJ family response regulator